MALLAIAAYGTQLGFHDRLARLGLALILGGAFGNLIDRAIVGHVVDFVDVYWRRRPLLGLQRRGRRDHGRRGPGDPRHARPRDDDMHPILFEIGGFPVYTYGVLLAAAYLLGLQFALVRARARGLDANRVMDLGIWIIISALIGAKLLLLVVDFDTFRAESARAADADAVGRGVLRRPDRRRRGGDVVHAPPSAAGVERVRTRSRRASRSAT